MVVVFLCLAYFDIIQQCGRLCLVYEVYGCDPEKQFFAGSYQVAHIGPGTPSQVEEMGFRRKYVAFRYDTGLHIHAWLAEIG